MSKWLSLGFLSVGVLLLFAGLTLRFAKLSNSDMRLALKPILLVSGDRITPEPHSWQAKIPAGPTWKRLEKIMGAPDYLLTAIHNGKAIQCLATTNVRATISVDGAAIAARPARFQPYGYSSECTGVSGIAFKAQPGSEVNVTLRSKGHELDFSEDILLVPVWHVNMKDKLVGAALSDDFWTSWSMVSVVGGLLCAAGLILSAGMVTGRLV